MPFPGGLWWLLCCRQGFTLLRRDYGEADREADGEAEEEASFELRAQGDQGSLEVSLSQPTRTSSGSERSLLVSEEMRSLIVEKGPGPAEDDPDALVKGWLQREVRGGAKTPWIRPRKYWFVLTPDSLDYYSSSERGAKRLGSLVLTSLCSVLWPDKQTYKETGYWSVTVFGRKHCYRLYAERLNEAVHWVCAVQKVIDSKAPVQTPTQLLMRDVEEHGGSPEALEQIYRCNPILRYTGSPLYAPLLPFPYGSPEPRAPGARGYATLRDEAVKLFNSLQQLEAERDPAPLIQGVLQTCLDLPPLVDEVYCQLVKQTTEPPAPGGQGDLRYWQLLTCMSCTFLPSPPVLRFLRSHLHRTEGRRPASEVAQYAGFIRAALGKTTGRECVPSLEEILVLTRRQEMVCTVHCPGAAACRVAISSHTTAAEVARELVSRLGLSRSPNLFALYEQSRLREQPVGSATLLADVLTRFENLAGEEREQDAPCRLCFKHYGFLDTENVPRDSLEFALLFEQAHEMVLRGQVPASEETLQTLAALRLQSLNGDFSTHAPCPRLEELFPAAALRARAGQAARRAGPAAAGPPARGGGRRHGRRRGEVEAAAGHGPARGRGRLRGPGARVARLRLHALRRGAARGPAGGRPAPVAGRGGRGRVALPAGRARAPGPLLLRPHLLLRRLGRQHLPPLPGGPRPALRDPPGGGDRPAPQHLPGHAGRPAPTPRRGAGRRPPRLTHPASRGRALAVPAAPGRLPQLARRGRGGRLRADGWTDGRPAWPGRRQLRRAGGSHRPGSRSPSALSFLVCFLNLF